jgi:mRNA-degrading endonuclease toxin of MazEF toxin-antitoxin module
MPKLRETPVSGLVVRYDYLWDDERLLGKVEGSKDRPCAVVLALQGDSMGRQLVIVAAITHTKPQSADAGIEISAHAKRMLGLDGERSWIIVTEVNVVDWSDPGFVPVKPEQWSYGSLPKALAIQVRNSISERAKSKRLGQVNR